MLAKFSVLNQTSIPVSSRGLDAYAQRGRAVSNNLANVTTPGYQRIEVSFEDTVKRYLEQNSIPGERSHHNHFSLGKPNLDMLKSETYRSLDQTKPGEVNNVDIDLEAAKMAENEIMFNFGVKFIRDRMEAIHSAIKTKG